MRRRITLKKEGFFEKKIRMEAIRLTLRGQKSQSLPQSLGENNARVGNRTTMA